MVDLRALWGDKYISDGKISNAGHILIGSIEFLKEKGILRFNGTVGVYMEGNGLYNKPRPATYDSEVVKFTQKFAEELLKDESMN